MLYQAISISKKFEDHLLFNNLSFDLELGKVYQVKGLNGSGKSTLLKILAGMLTPTTGKIQKKPFLKIGYSALDLNLYPDLTVNQTLKWCAEIKQTSLPKCFLNPNQMIKTLSSGQISYLKLLIATLNQPELLILDEVHATLDPLNKKIFLNLIQENQSQSALVFTSHEQELGIHVHQEIILD